MWPYHGTESSWTGHVLFQGWFAPPATGLSSLPLSAAQLDIIGFNIIKKCIHAVETRGKVVQQMALFSAMVIHVGRRQTRYLLFSDFK